MNLTAKILNSDATLNSWTDIGSLTFQPGETKTLQMRLFDQDEGIRFTPPAAAVMTVTFNTTTGTLVKTATLNADDRALATVALTAADTEKMLSGNFTFSIDLLGDSSQIAKGLVRSGLSKLVVDC